MAEFKLGRIKFVYQGTWQPSTSYVVDDVVTNGGKTYICVISNTSSSLFTTDLNNVTPYWNLVADGLSWKGNWSNSTYYNVGDLALYGGIVYECNTAHTSVSSTASITVTGITVSAGTATLTFATQAVQPYVVGATITLAGFSPTSTSGSVNTVNTSFTVVSCTTTNVTFALTGTYSATTLGTITGTNVLGLEASQSNWSTFAANFNWSNAWTTNTRYKLRDLIYYGGTTYVCNTAHVSANTIALGLEANSSYWDTFNQGINYLGAWNGSAVRYKLNDIVKYGADLWICTTPHTSSGTTIDTTKFTLFVAGFEFENSWSAGTTYVQGDVVTYGGYTYTAIQNNIAQVPSTATSYWQVFTSGLVYSGDWVSSTSYQVGDVVRLGGFTYVAVKDSSVQTITATATTAVTNVITVSSTANLAVGLPITFTGTSFGGINTTGTVYYILTASGTSITVGLTAGGSAITLTTATGSVTGTTNPTPPFATYWSRLNSGIRWNATSATYSAVAQSTTSGSGTSATFNVTTTNTAYSVTVNNGGSGYNVNDTITLLGTAVGGLTPANNIIVTVSSVSSGVITAITYTGYAVTWVSGTVYVAGDAVYFGNSSYICVSAHVGTSGNRPDNDVTATYWNLLASGADSGVLTTTGDIVYYGTNGATRLPIGTDGQVLRVNGNVPSWQYYGLLNNIVYVAPNGVDISGNGQGLTLDKPWASLLFACKQVEEGYLNTNAGTLLTINKQFMMKEVNNWISYNYTWSIASASSTGNVFTLASGNTGNMYIGMPIVFTGTTGGVTVGTTYYVYSIPTTTTFEICTTYGSSTASTLSNSSTPMTGYFSYVASKAERDTGTIIDCVIFDLTHGGNYKVSTATQAFFATITSFITTNATIEMPVWIASISYLNNTLMASAVNNVAPANNYQALNNVPVAARAIQQINTSYTAESGALSTAQGLLSIITGALTAGTYANIPQLQRPHTSIYLKTGTYNEYGPIVVPLDTAILGDELRSTIVQTAPAQPYLGNDKPKTVSVLNRIQSLIPAIVSNVPVTKTTGNTYSQQYINGSAPTLPTTTQSIISNTTLIQSILSGGLSSIPGAGTSTITYAGSSTVTVPNTGTYTLTTPTGYNTSTLTNTAYSITGLGVSGYTGNTTGDTTGYGYGVTQIQNNIAFLQTEIAAYMNVNYNSAWTSMGATYQGQTLRDIGYLLNAIIYDMTYGGNTQSQIEGLGYFSLGNNSIQSAYTTATTACLTRIQTIIGQIVTASAVTRTSGNAVSQSTSGTAGSSNAGTYAQALVGNVINWLNGTNTPSNGGSLSSGASLSGTVAPYYGWATSAAQSAFTAIQSKRAYIQQQIQSFVARQYPNIVYNLSLTYRDAGTIVDALSYDMVLGSTYYSMISGRAFWRYVPSAETLVGGAQLSPTQICINNISYLLAAACNQAAGIPTTTGDYGNDAAINLIVNNTAIIQNMFANGTVISGPTNSGYPGALGIVQEPNINMPTLTGYNSVSSGTAWLASYGYGVTQIQNNYQFIKDEIVNYLNDTLSGTTWSQYSSTYQAETTRDLSNILDAICYDMTYGCNDQSLIAGRAFYSLNSPVLVAPYILGTTTALSRLSTIISQIIQKTSVTPSAGNSTSQLTTGTAGSAQAAAFAQARIADIVYWINNGYQNTTTGTTTGTISGTTLTVASGTGLAIGQCITGATLTTTATATTGSTNVVTLASVTGLATGMPITFSVNYGYSNQAVFGGLTTTTYIIAGISGSTVTLYNFGTTTSPVLSTATGNMTVVAGIYPGTYITSGSGTTWTVSVSQTVATTTTITGTFTITPVVSGAYNFALPLNQLSFNAIQSQATLIANDAQAWVQRFYQNESPSLTLTTRDAGYVITALSYDVLLGGNFYSIVNGRAFNRLITSINNVQTKFADATYGAIGFIGAKTRYIASVGSAMQVSTTVDDMVAQINQQPSYSAQFTGSISGTLLTVTNVISGTISAGMQISGTGIATGTTIISGSGTSWLLNYSQNVSSVTTPVVGVVTSTNLVTLGSTAGIVPGLQITIAGTAISNLVAGTYYVYQVLNSTQLTLSTSFGGSVFAISATATGSMTATVYGIYGGLAVSTTITGTTPSVPVTAVTTGTNLITVNSTTGMSVNMPVVFNSLPSNIATTAIATTTSTNVITLAATASSSGIVAGQKVYFTGVMLGTIVFNQYYYVINPSGSTIQISNTLGGSAVALTSSPLLSSVQITSTAGAFSCTSTTLAVGQAVTVNGTLSTGSINGNSTITATTYYIIATNGSTTFTLSTTQGGLVVPTTTSTGAITGATFGLNAQMTVIVNAAGGLVNGDTYWINSVNPVTPLNNVAITATTGVFSCTNNGGILSVGTQIQISGVLNTTYSTGSITGYTGATTTYYVIGSPTSTAFQLSLTSGGSAITTVVGSLAGLDFTVLSTPNTITVTNSYKSGTALTITNSLTGLTAGATVGVAAPQNIISKIHNGTAGPGYGVTAYQSYSGYNNSITTIQGAELIRANINFLANEAAAWTTANYGGTITTTTNTTASITGYISGYTLTVSSVVSGAVAIGMTVGNASAGTYITAGSGTSWTVSVYQTTGSSGSPVSLSLTNNIVTTSIPHNLTVGDPVQINSAVSATFTITGTVSSGNQVTVNSTANLIVGMQVVITGSTLGTSGNPQLVAGTYYILTIGSGYITLSSTYGGSTYSVSTASGTMTGVAGGIFGGLALNTLYWVLTVPTNTTMTLTTTQPGTGSQTSISLIGATGSAQISYYSIQSKLIRDVSYYLMALIYDLNVTGNYKSLRFIQIYLSCQGGSQATDLFHVRNGTGIRNMTLNGMTGALAVPNSFGTRRPTAGSYVSLDPGFGPNDNSVWGNVRSCYVQNVTNFGSGCVGMKIDAALHNGGNRSILANDFTQVLSDGIGVYATGHGALTECVSVFSYYGYTGYLSEFGARIRATNGNSSYGTYGVIAEGIDSYETPIYATLNNRANPAYVTNVVTDGANQVLRLEYENAGSAYTNNIPTVNGSGYNIVTIGDEFRDSAVFETRLVDLNNGQGVGGSNYLTASNTAQGGTSTSLTLGATDTQLSSAYVGMRVQLTAGTGVGQYANIVSYNNGSKTALVSRPQFTNLTITTNSTSVFTVSSTNTLYANMPVYFGTNIGGLTSTTLYYVVGSTLSNNGTTFSVSTSSGGAAATLTATSATPAVMSNSSIIGQTLTVGTVASGTIYVGMLLSGLNVASGTYITANVSGSGAGSVWTVNVSQSVASTTIIGTINVTLYAAGWDHVVPGLPIQSTLDLTTTYIIEPQISYSSPGLYGTSTTLSATATWGAVCYGAGYFVAVASGGTATSYSTNGTTWNAGGALPSSASWNNVQYVGGQGATANLVVGGLGGSGAVLTPILGTGASSGQIVGVTIVNGGYNYTTPPTLVITAIGSGSGAVAVAEVLNGSITQINMTTNGSGYTSGATVAAVTGVVSSVTAVTYGKNYFTTPTITISAPFSATTWSSGGTASNGTYYSNTTLSGVTNYYLATSNGTFASGVSTTYGPITQANQTNGTVSLTWVGTLAVATANLTNAGISSYNLTTAGYGYTFTPSITISDPNAYFVAVSSNSTASAYQAAGSLGSAWTNNSVAMPASNYNSFAYGNNTLVVVGGTSTTPSAASIAGGNIASGTANWTNRSITGSVTYASVCYGNGYFVAINSSGTTTAISSNGSSWSAGGALSSSTTWVGVAYGNGRYVALAANGTLNYSYNNSTYSQGALWNAVLNNPLSTSGISTWSKISYGQGLFVAIATGTATTATSWDGINWTVWTTSPNALPSSSSWTSLAFGNPQSGTLGAVPTWVAISSTSGTIGAKLQTGATPQGRIKVVSAAITEIRMIEPGSGFPRGNVTGTAASGNTITVDSTINLVAGQPIVFNGTSAGGITTGVYYYVQGSSLTSTTFSVSATSTGTPITLTNATISGMTYYASPIVTQTDPNKVNTASVVARIGTGALGNPTFSNRGTANTTATASVSGDGYADLYQTGTFINVSGLYQAPTAGANVVFSTIPNTWYKLVQVTNLLGTPGNYTATFQINPGLSTLLAPPNGTLITTNLLYSQVRLTGHDFLYIGTGNLTATNYPNVNPANQITANQELATGGGRVFFTSTDQDGNFNVGNLFGVQQSTGTATLNASAFNLAGLQSLTLGNLSLGVGSATITQFSTDPYFTANSDNIVPTQKAIKAYITAQIGGGASTLNVNTLTAGQIQIAGNTILNTAGTQIYVSGKMYFISVDGAPVSQMFFYQR